MSDVHHNADQRRFEAEVEGGTAHVSYVREEKVLALVHTQVPPDSRGEGVAESVVRAALEWAREQGLSVQPLCRYVAVFVERNPEYADLVE
jgi:uncharacterized protein